MATIYLTSTAGADAPDPLRNLHRLIDAATRDRVGQHELVSDPQDASLVIFVELGATIELHLGVWASELARRRRQDCFLYSEADITVPLLPGMYTAATRSWRSRHRVRGGFYLRLLDDEDRPVQSSKRPLHLYSFVGRVATHPIRSAVASLDHPGGHISTTDHHHPYGELPNEVQDRLRVDYLNSLDDSRFVLCPRGRGPSSYRVFEAMRAGRVPVIISDDWVAPRGPDWTEFAIRVRERDIANIPHLLEERDEDRPTLARASRNTWDVHFAQDSIFNYIIETMLEIREARPRPERVADGILAADRQSTVPAVKKLVRSVPAFRRKTG